MSRSNLIAALFIAGLLGLTFYLERHPYEPDKSDQSKSYTDQDQPWPSSLALPLSSYPSATAMSFQDKSVLSRPKTGWRKYTNDKYGFTFWYPSEMETADCSKFSLELALYYSIGKDTTSGSPCIPHSLDPVFWIKVVETGEPADRVNEWTARNFNVIQNTIRLGNKTAYQFDLSVKTSLKRDASGVIFDTDGNPILGVPHKFKSIRVPLNGNAILLLPDLSANILSTFEFTP